MRLSHVASFVVAFLAFADPQTGLAQRPAFVYKSDTYAVRISMEKESVAAPDAPIVLLAIKNISDKAISRDDCSSVPEVWVQGVHGEPPTTYRERFSTRRLQPGEPDLMCTLNMTWSLVPGETLTRHILLKDLYDLREPGSYSVYVEFPTGNDLLRTNTVTFHIAAAAAARNQFHPIP